MPILPFTRKPAAPPFPVHVAKPAAVDPTKPDRAFVKVPPAEIVTRRNPRHDSVEQFRVDSLAASMVEVGQLEPIEVRPLGKGDARRKSGAKYELVFGERRWHAAKAASLPFVEVLVKEMTDAQAADRALVENQERERVTVWSLYQECVERQRAGQGAEDIARLAHMKVGAVEDLLTIANNLAPDISEKLAGACDADTIKRMLRCAREVEGIGRVGKYDAQRKWWASDIGRPLPPSKVPARPKGRRSEPARVRASTIVNFADRVERERLLWDARTDAVVSIPPELAGAVADTLRRWAKPSQYGPSPADGDPDRE